ncbi:hypothetical protein WJ972_28770 [Achromobacter insuavis]
MNANRAHDAVRLLEGTVAPDPADRALLDAWRGFALQLSGRRAESVRLLETLATGESEGRAWRAACWACRRSTAEAPGHGR